MTKTTENTTTPASILKLEASIGDRQNTWNYDYTWDCPVPEGLTTTHEGLLQKGFGELLRDASSTCKAKNAAGQDIEVTPEHRNTAVLARLAKFKDGTYVFGGGGTGGGSKLTIEVAGRIAFYNAKASKFKIKGQVANGKNIEEYDFRFVKQAIWDDLRAEMTSMSEAEQRDFVQNEVPQIVQDNMEDVLKDAMADLRPAMMGDFVESEKRKRTGQTAPTFKAKARIIRRASASHSA